MIKKYLNQVYSFHYSIKHTISEFDITTLYHLNSILNSNRIPCFEPNGTSSTSKPLGFCK